MKYELPQTVEWINKYKRYQILFFTTNKTESEILEMNNLKQQLSPYILSANDVNITRQEFVTHKEENATQAHLPSNIGLGNVDNTSDLNKPISTATQTALDTKVDNSRVLTDVPLNAKFTDTVTTINGKTGAISKDDIVALGVPAQDTVYSHPSSHLASMIIESTTKRFVSDAEKAEWNSKSIKNIGTFNSHEELIMYAVTEQIPTGQYAFFMGGAGHASLALVRDAGTYYEGMAQGSDGLYVIFDVTKQGQMREYGELYARDIIASFDDIRSIFSQLDDKVDNSRVLTDVPANAKFTDTVYTHPSSHPASIIEESVTKRFVTDVEKANWDTVADKVDKVAGKDLSSEDYTTEEKQKLEGIEQNANHTSNLTLNELTLGSRFKIVYNDIEDSLDIEVI